MFTNTRGSSLHKMHRCKLVSQQSHNACPSLQEGLSVADCRVKGVHESDMSLPHFVLGFQQVQGSVDK
jgi:hypothetical protein